MRVADMVNGIMIYRDATPAEIAESARVEAEMAAMESLREPTLVEKLDALLRYQGLTVKRTASGVFEVVKEPMPTGDYTNPIRIPAEGITTEAGKWYYVDDKELPHEALQDAFVMVEDFDDRTWFDYVE